MDHFSAAGKTAFLLCLLAFQCLSVHAQVQLKTTTVEGLTVGAARFDEYIPLLKGKKTAVVGNHTSLVDDVHLVDTLLSLGVDIIKVMAPEHGFRGKADAGEKVSSGKDPITGLPIVSLYGSHKKPTAEDLAGVDVVLFDIQDVGARFYTYISTMAYVMEAAAENNVSVMVLDRPNPHGFYVDGPLLDTAFSSFVGMHPVPVVHGMTIGEYAQMVNAEGWLKNGINCQLTVIGMTGYDHKTAYQLPVKPSPNLPNMTAVYLYPSLCFFEGTTFSVGRGTDFPFQLFGHPDMFIASYAFVPKSMEGAKSPKWEGTPCLGWNLSDFGARRIMEKQHLILDWLVDAYRNFPHKDDFFLKNGFFDKLAGTDTLRKQIEAGMTADEIAATWLGDLAEFKRMRKKYLLYADFE